MNYSHCRDCDAAILAMHTSTGARICIDAAPIGGGEWRIDEEPGDVWRATKVGWTIDLFDATDTGYRFTDHAETCPVARAQPPKPRRSKTE